MRYSLLILCGLINSTLTLSYDDINLIGDYFAYKGVKHVCYLSCEEQKANLNLAKRLMAQDVRVQVKKDLDLDAEDLETSLMHWNTAVGVLLDGNCDNITEILETCSSAKIFMFDALHIWLVLAPSDANYLDLTYNYNDTSPSMAEFIEDNFQNVNLSVDTDIAVVFPRGDHYKLVDVFNFGKIQGNHLEKNVIGTWGFENGLNIAMEGFKYYNRWDFHNLTLRAISVILDRPKVFNPEMLEDVSFTPGVSAMTKIVMQLLNILKEKHNFRFNYTIAGRWVGYPQRNSTLAVTNALFWREQDISATCLRIYPRWLDWVDPFLPPATHLQTKIYYLIPSKGVGSYENRFITPLSNGVWICAGVASLACIAVLACSAACERRPQPALYAVCSVVAAVCQQAYEDGVQFLEEAFSSQSRRLTLLVIGLTSMLLYNYYTSSVVSWLLSAAPPTLANLDGLIHSDLEMVFEDIGYSRQWLEGQGFYYSGFVNLKEDELRDVKVTHAKRTVPILLPVTEGIELIRKGPYAYHSEPYTASQVIGRRFSEQELCELGALQMMRPAHVYIMGQKQSPYKEFFTWSLMRLLERGHTQAARARVEGTVPPCSGQIPRALALGQAAPAFVLLAELYVLAVVILVLEIVWHRVSGGGKESVHAKNQRERAITRT